jgi:hypothetical protein
MRLGSVRDGLAVARQGQAEERPRLDFAKAQSVSPLRTLIVVAALVLAMGLSTGDTATSGRLSWAPARIRLGLAIFGLRAKSSRQRLPRPRFSCANFQSESPGRTLIVCCVAITAEGARVGCAG